MSKKCIDYVGNLSSDFATMQSTVRCLSTTSTALLVVEVFSRAVFLTLGFIMHKKHFPCTSCFLDC